MDRVAIFVDAGNMFFAQKANGWWVDWKLAFQLKVKISAKAA